MLSLALMLQYAASTTLPAPAVRLERMTALYDEVCLKAFPDDAAVDAAMRQRGAVALSPSDVRVTLGDDPGRGWQLAGEDGYATVFVEMPPYHACSVRWPMPAVPTALDSYRAATDAYKRTRPGFTPSRPLDADMKDIHVHMESDQRPTDKGGFDTLMVVDQHITDLKRRLNGDTGVELRFVHQIADPGAH
jgi:hypothetical protein